MYLSKFDDAGRRVTTVVSGIHFKTNAEKQAYIDDGYIETSDEDYQYYVGNMGNGANGTGYILGKDGKPTDAPAYEPSKEELISQLDQQYDNDKAALINAYTDSLMSDDTDTVDAIKAELVALNEQYDADYQAIIDGEGE